MPARFAAGVPPDVDARLRPLLPEQPESAAVLVPFAGAATDPSLLLTVRAAALRQHAGQVSFPGGRLEPGEDAAAAALREAREEIGLEPASVEVLGYLPDHLSLTGWRVTPVVARISGGTPLRLDPAEVSSAFELPFRAVLDDRAHERRVRSFGGEAIELRDIRHGPHLIWGLTAAILLTLREYADD